MPKKVWKPTNTAREFFGALQALGGEADNTKIAARTGYNPNGISVTFGSLKRRGYVRRVGGKRSNPRWKVLKSLP